VVEETVFDMTNGVLRSNAVRVKYSVRTVPDETPLPPLPWHKAPRAAPRRQLTRAAIVEAALDLLDREGLDAVSMRRVAQVLDTGAASLYQHVGNKDELVALVFDRVTGEVPLPEAGDPQRWQQQLREALTNVWRAMIAHRGIAAVAIGSIPSGPNALAFTEGLSGIVLAGGLSKQQCAWAIDNLFKFVTADAYEQSLFDARSAHESHYPEIERYFRSLPPERFPNITSMLDELFTGGGEERFAFGLDMMIAGLGAMGRVSDPSS
jgi:AcrR family transcriptional regulator